MCARSAAGIANRPGTLAAGGIDRDDGSGMRTINQVGARLGQEMIRAARPGRRCLHQILFPVSAICRTRNGNNTRSSATCRHAIDFARCKPRDQSPPAVLRIPPALPAIREPAPPKRSDQWLAGRLRRQAQANQPAAWQTFFNCLTWPQALGTQTNEQVLASNRQGVAWGGQQMGALFLDRACLVMLQEIVLKSQAASSQGKQPALSLVSATIV